MGGVELARAGNCTQAQHCLVRSLQLETSATAWTNLGAVYMALGDHTLANKAFKEAQAAQPDYVRGWAGQALLAETLGYKFESLDLLRHCTFLGQEEESARGYGDGIISALERLSKGEKIEAHSKYILEQMWGVRVGVDSLTKHTSRKPSDANALCQLALLQERVGLLRSALDNLQLAAEVVEKEGTEDQKDIIKANRGRLLSRLGRNDEAVETLQGLTKTSLQSTAVLHVPNLSTAEHLMAVIRKSGVVGEAGLSDLSKSLSGRRANIGVKKLLGLLDMVAQTGESERARKLLAKLEEEMFVEYQ